MGWLFIYKKKKLSQREIGLLDPVWAGKCPIRFFLLILFFWFLVLFIFAIATSIFHFWTSSSLFLSKKKKLYGFPFFSSQLIFLLQNYPWCKWLNYFKKKFIFNFDILFTTIFHCPFAQPFSFILFFLG